MSSRNFVFGAAALLLCSASALAAEPDYFEMSIEELININVRTVSKKEVKATESPAAVFVITQEDIRRSGATSIPEVLRIAPGIQVAKINANKWAVSSRGYNRQLSNKLLVLIDGRSVYTPLFSGVYWDVQDTMLEDIEKIEVIRGPGATLWGANAVNGVINIITKKAKDTQGNIVSAGGGTEENAFISARHGGNSDGVYYRTYAKYNNRDESENLRGQDAGDAWYQYRGGFKAEWEQTQKDSITVQGDIYTGREDFTNRLPITTAPFIGVSDSEETFNGGNILARWARKISDGSAIEAQFYYDHAYRANSGIFAQTIDVADIDFQHSLKLNDKNNFIWGLGYRLVSDNLDGTTFLSYTPSTINKNLFSGFLQNEFKVTDELALTIGSKFEHNDYTGFEEQPSARLMWTPNSDQSVWASVARAVRTPSRGEDGINALVQTFPAGALGPGTPAGSVRQLGKIDVESEEMTAYEVGYRVRPTKELSLDFATFFNDYTNIRTIDRGAASVQAGNLLIPLYVRNNAYGESYGFEVSANYEVTDKWRLAPAYTFLVSNIHLNAGSSDTTTEMDEGRSPRNQVSLRSYYNINRDIEVNNAVYWVEGLGKTPIESYIRFDTVLAWKALDNLELSLVGTNLFDDNHPEFNENLFSESSQAGRSVYAKVTWKF